MMAIAKRLLVEEEGQSMAEYSILSSGIAMAVMASVVLLGDSIEEVFEYVAKSISSIIKPEVERISSSSKPQDFKKRWHWSKAMSFE